MKRLTISLMCALSLAVSVGAHGDNDHVRGVVTEVSASSLTVQLAPQGTKTLVLNDKTTFEKSGKPAHLADLKVGDRVIVDVPKGSNEARLIKFGATPPKKAE